MATRFSKEEFFRKAEEVMSDVLCVKKAVGDSLFYEGDIHIRGEDYAFKVEFCYNPQCCYCANLFYIEGSCDFYNSFGVLTKEDLDDLLPPYYNKLPRKGESYQGNIFEDLYLFQ